MCSGNKRAYLKEGRLQDVLALMQVLGLDSLTYRSETGVEDDRGDGGLAHELKNKPLSANTWTDIAKGHPEFFRVDESKTYPVSLVCRHIHQTSPTLKKTEFDRGMISKLMELAIEIHDREVKRSQSWTLYIPLWTAAISGLILLAKGLVG